MENFDELMRHKYDNDDPAGRFEFREEYWEQARVLIEADEARRRKKRRWLLWWTCTGLLLVLCAGLGWWRMTSGDFTADGGRIQMEDGGRRTANGGQELTAPSSGLPQQNSAAPTADSMESNSAIIEGNHSNIIENEGENQYNNAKSRNVKSDNSQQGLAASNQKVSVPNAGQKQTTSQKSNNGRPQPKGTVTNALEIGQVPTLTTNHTTDPSNAVFNPKTASEPAMATAAQPHVGMPDTLNAPPTQNQSTAELPKKIASFLKQLFTLPLPYPPVKRDSVNAVIAPDKVESPPMATPIKPVQDQRFVFGLSAAATAYQPTPDQHWLGFSTAAFCTRQLKGHWLVSLGLGLRYQPGNWIDSSELETTETLRYSFGYEARYSEQRNAGLFYLELPIAAVWQRGNIAFEAGVAPGRLFYALDRIKTSEETSLESRKTIQNRLQKGNTSPYGKTYVNTLVGAEWRISPNTSLFLRGNYRLGNMVKATAETKAVRGGASAELGVKLKLF